jgi:hypothetical protein
VLAVAFRQARGLARTADPIEAEMIASSLVAMWTDLEMVDVADTAVFFTQAMIDYLVRRGTPDALALLHGLNAVDPVRTVIDSHRAIRRLRDSGIAEPRWAEQSGRARFVHAWVASDVFGDQDFLVARFSYQGEAPHDLAVLVDHNILDIAKDIDIAAATADLRAHWEGQPDIAVRNLSEQAYTDQLADALANLGMTWEPPITEGARPAKTPGRVTARLAASPAAHQAPGHQHGCSRTDVHVVPAIRARTLTGPGHAAGSAGDRLCS